MNETEKLKRKVEGFRVKDYKGNCYPLLTTARLIFFLGVSSS